jgi:hypothetical protein
MLIAMFAIVLLDHDVPVYDVLVTLVVVSALSVALGSPAGWQAPAEAVRQLLTTLRVRGEVAG